MKLPKYHKSKIISSKLTVKRKKTPSAGFDWITLFLTILLVLFGIIFVYDSSSVSASYDLGSPYYFLKEQIKWVVIGFMVLIICYKIRYQRWYSLSVFLIIIAIGLLLLVLLPGIGPTIKGAKRWLPFGGQPSEFAKLALIIYLSAWFSNREKNRLWAFLILCGVIVGLILLQPDMGTAIVVGIIAVILYFISGAPLFHFLMLMPITLGIGYLLIKIAPYRFARLTTFLNSNNDPLGASYHIRQILIALGSGGWFGIGLGKSRQKYSYVPESNTDSIFAIIGEEIGFLGSILIISFLFMIVIRGLKIARYAPNTFGKLLATGISSWIAIQVIINLASMVALVPLTGVPLPLISYGGSSLIVIMAGIGILLNISKATK